MEGPGRTKGPLKTKKKLVVHKAILPNIPI
jgi:hypothetical protein